MIDKFANLTDEQKAKHFEQLVEYREQLKKEPELKQLFIEMTLNCNQHCLHCGSNAGCSSELERLTDDEIYDTLVELKQDLKVNGKRLPFIIITGGEPLMRPGVIDLMRRLRDLGYKWGMTSNGSIITPAVAKQLRDADMYSIGISLDGLEEHHDWFRGTPGAYKKALDAFKNLTDVGQEHVMLTTVLNKLNIGDLDELYKLMLDIGCKTWRIINMEPIGRALDNKDLMLDNSDYKTMVEFIVNHQDNPNLNVIFGCNHYLGLDYERKTRPWYYMCQAGICVASIQYNGDITACLDIERRPELVFGNVRKDLVYDVWMHKFEPFRDTTKTWNSTTCKDCKHKANCDGGGWHTWNFDTHEPRLCMLDVIGRK